MLKKRSEKIVWLVFLMNINNFWIDWLNEQEENQNINSDISATSLDMEDCHLQSGEVNVKNVQEMVKKQKLVFLMMIFRCIN